MDLKLVDTKDQLQVKQVMELKKFILKYLSGKNINLIDAVNELDFDLNLNVKFPTKFSQKIYTSLLSVNYGELTNYSEIGEKIGSKAYRAIGNVLRRNSLPLIIPCHRVIRKNGDIGGFMGTTEKSWQLTLKKNLIEIEKIPKF
ncbi:MAG: methylated-DNA--[protein]-cysteine S-methyltransferase [Promethearchaeota archaeon]|jgi:methylated-DNA-[protein]-cysteine S-methyltransferase